MSDIAFDMARGAGRRLADWIERVQSRPLPAYLVGTGDDHSKRDVPKALAERLRQMGVAESEIGRAVAELQRQFAELEAGEPGMQPDGEAAAPPDASPVVELTSPDSIAAIGQRWRSVFPLGKPFSVHPLPWGDADPWDPGTEPQWMQFLERHPESFDSLDVLDDLATATMLHRESDQLGVVDRLGRPLLERGVAILEQALVNARPAVPPARLPWGLAVNRPALRSLYRLHELEVHARREGEARRLAERLLTLNPDDNHGVRCWLAGACLKAGDPEACLRLAEAYPDDLSPELRFNAALALYRLGRARSATETLELAHRTNPRVTRSLISRRVARPAFSEYGVSLDGDDRAWLYREDMRSTWAATPGALEWVAKVVGHSLR